MANKKRCWPSFVIGEMRMETAMIYDPGPTGMAKAKMTDSVKRWQHDVERPERSRTFGESVNRYSHCGRSSASKATHGHTRFCS